VIGTWQLHTAQKDDKAQSLFRMNQVCFEKDLQIISSLGYV